MTRVLLGVKGMNSPEAVEAVTQALLAMDGVSKVEASVQQQASVEYDPAEVTTMDLIRTMRRLGFLAGMD